MENKDTEIDSFVSEYVQEQKQYLSEIESIGNVKHFKNLMSEWETYLKKHFGENYKGKLKNVNNYACEPIQLNSDAPSYELNRLDLACLNLLLGYQVEALSDTFIVKPIE